MILTELKEVARQIRRDTLEMVYAVKSGHPGGALSIAELLTVLYFAELQVRPENPEWEDRDRLILSKGHACTSLYAALAERGYFPKKQLFSLRQYQSILQGHPDMKVTPGVDMSSGSLGQGLSVGNGMALAARLQHKTYRVYVLLGDGELEEGQVWEAAMAAAHYGLGNLTAIVDVNGLQINGATDEVMRIEPLDEKFRSFGWQVVNIDGHDIEQIQKAFDAARECEEKPTVILAKTIKGKGVSFMENQAKWHSGVLTEAEYQQAMQELGGEA